MSLVKPGAEPVRHLKIGSVIVREYEGKIHEVMVARSPKSPANIR
jgi:hypothetical protein